MAELRDDVHRQIQQLCQQGDRLADQYRFSDSLTEYWAAWDLLPDPKTQWTAATWILGAIGDANFRDDSFEAGKDNLSLAMHCPNGIGNAFLHLRLGQCQFELGNLERAADELARAYMGGGTEIFDDDDPKYFEFLKTRLQPPPRGWT